jgi:hypothetical protein
VRKSSDGKWIVFIKVRFGERRSAANGLEEASQNDLHD